MKYKCKLFISILITALLLGIQHPATRCAAVTGQDANIEKIDDYLMSVKGKVPSPGFSVVVVQNDKIVFTKGYGVEIAGTNNPMTENTSTAIGSFTKSFTALAMMQLVEKGAVKLDDPVQKYLPWFKTANEELSKKITIRMVLGNSSGLPSRDLFNQSVNRLDYDMEKIVRGLSSCILSGNPGQSFEYSNEGFDVAGVIIEKVSGMKYEDYIQKNILDPLEMSKSTTDYRKFEELKVLYGHIFDNEKAIPAKKSTTLSYLAAGSEMRCSAENIGHYLIALMNDGIYNGNKIISQKSIDEMWKPAISFPGFSKDLGFDGKDWYYGMGWMSADISGRNLIFHGGSTTTMTSFTAIDKENKLAVSILSNGGALDSYRFSINETVVLNILDIMEERPLSNIGIPTKKDPSVTDFRLPDDLKNQYIGEYVSKGGEAKAVIYMDENGKMLFQLDGASYSQYCEVVFTNKSQVYLKNLSGGLSAAFKLTASGEVTGLESPTLYGSFLKVKENKSTEFTKFSSADGRVSFKLPNDCSVEWNSDSFEVTSTEFSGMRISGKFADKSFARMTSIIEKELKNEGIFSEGEELDDTIYGNMWKEKSVVTLNKGIKQHKYIVFTQLEDGSVFYMILSCDYGNLPNTLRNVFMPIVNNLVIKQSLEDSN